MTSSCTLYTNAKFDILKSYFGKCENPACNETGFQNLQFAHLKETPISRISRGRGKYQRLKDILEHPDSYTLLCEIYCHRAYDIGVLKFNLRSLADVAPKLPPKLKGKFKW